jgi:sugar/nucleoside kinase (ribokinase family)
MNMPEKFDLIGLGICSVDFLGLVKKYPAPGEKIPMAAFSKQGGGLTGTALVAAARLGAKTAYIGKLGDDEYSRFLLEEFQKDGVNIDHVIFEEGAQPPVAFIHVEQNSGERRIARYWKEFELKPKELDVEMIRNSRVLFLEHHFVEAGIFAARVIKQAGGLAVVDAERNVAGFDQILHAADYIIVAQNFATQQTGCAGPEQSADWLQQKYGGIIVVTAGENGAFCRTPETFFHQPAFQVDVVDTTGAGDVFHGAFTMGLLENWPLPKILEFAAVVAAMKCRGLGGRAMIPRRKEAVAFLRARGAAAAWK